MFLSKCFLPFFFFFSSQGGATIKEINKQTGAHCEVDRTALHDGDEKIFIMRGYPNQIEFAKKFFREKAGITSDTRDEKISRVHMEALPKAIGTQGEKLIDPQVEKVRIFIQIYSHNTF